MPPRREPAVFWDGAKQLPGTLELSVTELSFEFDDFRHTHLSLGIQLVDIQYAKAFLIFDVARKGLKIVSKDGIVDLFILENSPCFCRALNEQVQKIAMTLNNR